MQYFMARVGSVAGNDVHVHQYWPDPVPPDDPAMSVQCWQCRRLTWRYTAHCVHCAVGLGSSRRLFAQLRHRVGARVALLGAALLASCATAPTPLALAKPAPAERVAWAAPAAANATLVVVRDRGFLGAGCYYALWVDGVLAARLGPEEVVHLRVAAGERVVAVSRDPQGAGVCSSEVQPNRVSREVRLAPSETKRYRLAITEGNMDVMRADTE